MKRYNPSDIEPKWQQRWAESQRYTVAALPTQPKYYISPMFPYPSGVGMHTGHAFEHAIVDAAARYQRAQGKVVLNPLGWDAFGLPAENFAIKTGQAPQETTRQNIANFKHQMQRMGSSIDWSREITTSDPEYYKWTQWIFTQFFERGLAYQKESSQWWCPVDKTVLANEQVEGGHCWRCGSLVEKRRMKQWFFRITEYADRLLEGLDRIDWPQHIKTAQRNWIGRSLGAEITFQLDDAAQQRLSSEQSAAITVFSTRPDTIFGATFLVLAPEHELATTIASSDQKELVEEYIAAALRKSDVERMADTKGKSGVFTGAYAHNPATGELVPIWVADYVLGGYGTGAVMAVPAHDERDYAFAQAHTLPIIEVIEGTPKEEATGAYSGVGTLKSSGHFSGMDSKEVQQAIVDWLEEKQVAQPRTMYKMRDWLISRQRYWGAPIPIVHCPEHGAVAVPADQLPVVLPVVDEYKPKGDGRSVLASEESWVATSCPTCGGPARRETDTMDGFACSSWYLFRYTDPHNAEQPFAKDKADAWMPLDLYVGGDHAVAHLLYLRFWTKVFYDMGLVSFDEPAQKLAYHGYVNAADGTKMSKSKGNVIDPLEVIDQGYGADALKTYLLFMGPIDDDSAWDPNGIAGVYRFLGRVWTLAQEYMAAAKAEELTTDAELTRQTQQTIKKVTGSIDSLSFNTAIAALMEWTNAAYKLKTQGFSRAWQQSLTSIVQLLQPFAPHMSAELWEQLGGSGPIDTAPWPTWDERVLATQTMTIIVQVNGKLRAKLSLPVDATAEEVLAAAKSDEHVQQFIAGGIRKEIYVPGRIVNFVAQ